MDQTELLLYTKSTAIAIHQFDKSFQPMFTTLADIRVFDHLIQLPIYHELMKKTTQPQIQYISDTEIYGHFYFKESYYIIGPILHHPILTLKDRYDLSFYTSLTKPEWQQLTNQIPIMSQEAFAAHLTFLYYLITHQHCTKISIPSIKSKPMPEIQYSDAQLEVGLNHIKEAIEKRDLTEIETITTRNWHGYKYLMSLDTFKQSMYLFISILSFCVQFATQQGANFHDALALKDAYILQADQTHDRKDLLNRFKAFMYDIIALIPSPEYSKEICSCLHYIHHHLDETLSTTVLSQECHLSRAYLCTRFKKEVGQSMAEYILFYRIAQAKKELVQSSVPIVDIAEKLGFKSQSHFTIQFKKQTKMTPKEWRQKGLSNF